MPWLRPIVTVSLCSKARRFSAASSASRSASRMSEARTSCTLRQVSSTSDEVIPWCTKRASSPTCSARCVRNAITSCLVTASISSIRATSNSTSFAFQIACRRGLRDHPQLGLRVRRMRLDLEPDAEPRLRRPDLDHLGTGIARDHRSAFRIRVAPSDTVTPGSAQARLHAAPGLRGRLAHRARHRGRPRRPHRHPHRRGPLRARRPTASPTSRRERSPSPAARRCTPPAATSGATAAPAPSTSGSTTAASSTASTPRIRPPPPAHDCPPDSYRVRYDFRAWPRWQAEWRVTGPRKDYGIVSRFRPADAAA